MIKVNTQASIKIVKDKVIYFDPYNITEVYNDADYIFITHDHYDHYDEKSINNIIKKETLIIVPTILKNVTNKYNNVLIVEPNKDYDIGNIKFSTTYSYNINKSFHPKENNNVGYIIDINNTKYYIMGDTDIIDEISDIKTDVCFIPIGGTYTCDYVEAANYINKIKPKKVIPIHYGSIVGDITLGNKFKELIDESIEVEILIK